MTDRQLLTLLKLQIQILTNDFDEYLTHIIDAAKEMVQREGIVLDTSAECGQVVVMQAAYLYNKRNTNEGEPRSLRYRKNNLLFSQKIKRGGGDSCEA